MHPLAQDLSGLSDDEVHKKFNELQKKFQQAYKFGPQAIIPQIQMMMEHFQNEIQRRNQKQMEEMMKKAEEGGRGFKKIIDIQ